MKWWLSKSAVQFREQVDDNFPDRDRRSDGTLGDARHALKPSSHNPDPETGVVRGLDIDADLRLTKSISIDLAEQCRIYEKQSAGNSKRQPHVHFSKRRSALLFSEPQAFQ